MKYKLPEIPVIKRLADSPAVYDEIISTIANASQESLGHYEASGRRLFGNQSAFAELMENLDLVKLEIGGRMHTCCNARTLHAELGVGRDFTSWIKERLNTYDFQEGVDFLINPMEKGVKASLLTDSGEQTIVLETFDGSRGRGGHNKTEYYVTVNLAKELALLENNPKGKALRRKIIEVDERYTRMCEIGAGVVQQKLLTGLRAQHKQMEDYGVLCVAAASDMIDKEVQKVVRFTNAELSRKDEEIEKIKAELKEARRLPKPGETIFRNYRL